jgi:hypothetical protein
MPDLYAAGAKADITPPVGIAMDGYSARPNPSTGIHDRLYSRVLLLRANGKTFAVISCDLCWLGDTTVAEVRERAKAVGVDEVLLTATHTHSGPAMADFIVGPRMLEAEYVLSLPSQIIDAVKSASQQLRPVTAVVSAGETNLSVNRRMSSLPVDHTVVSLAFQDDEGKPAAEVLNYACHPTVLGPPNRQISADYPGRLSEIVEGSRGGAYVSLFLNGACGDVNPSTCDGYHCEGTFADVSTMARRLAAASLDSSDGTPFGCSEIRFERSRVGPLPPWGLSFELTAMNMGGVALLAAPGELFASTGLWLRRKFSPLPLLIVGFANGYAGYFPTKDSFDRRDYETKRICWVDASAEEVIRSEATALIEKTGHG